VGWTAISPESSQTFWAHNYNNPRDMIQTRPMFQIHPPLRYTTAQNKKDHWRVFFFDSINGRALKREVALTRVVHAAQSTNPPRRQGQLSAKRFAIWDASWR
jgi:hypothetical protein